MQLPDVSKLDMGMRSEAMGEGVDAASYGVLEQRVVASDIDKAAEELTHLGYAVVDSGYSSEQIDDIGRMFDAVHGKYVDTYGKDFLMAIDEYNGIRLPLAFDDKLIDLAANRRVLDVVKNQIDNEFVLNQQNGIINPPGEKYNQGAWHRDLPYQHFVSTKPLAINALYCVDDFTSRNGATLVIPASHTQEKYPSDHFIEANATQVTAPAGSFIVLNGMLFHKGGFNDTSIARRAVNHVYTVAFIKQQIDIPSALADRPIQSAELDVLLGYRYRMPRTIDDFLEDRRQRAESASA